MIVSSCRRNGVKMNRCEDDLDLLSEDEAIREILTQHNALHVQGAVILIEGRVGAFTAGREAQ